MINRRKFIGLMAASAAFMAAPLKGLARAAELSPSLSGGRFKATVLRCECYADLQSAYLCDPELGPCGLFKVGQTFTFTSGDELARVCPRMARALAEGRDSLRREPLSLVSCGSGSRPVIVKVEALS